MKGAAIPAGGNLLIRRTGSGERLVGGDGDEGIQPRILRRDRGQRVFSQPLRLDRPPRELGRKLGNGRRRQRHWHRCRTSGTGRARRT